MSTRQKQIKLTINGNPYELSVKPKTLLIDLLNSGLGLTGAKRGCDCSSCGACTVILNGKAAKSCSILAVQADGKEVITIEGLSDGAKLHPIQQAFVDNFAVQCGYCTPGMIMSAKALLDANPDPSDDEIKRAIAGNLCRCTGYTKIFESIRVAAKNMGGKR